MKLAFSLVGFSVFGYYLNQKFRQGDYGSTQLIHYDTNSIDNRITVYRNAFWTKVDVIVCNRTILNNILNQPVGTSWEPAIIQKHQYHFVRPVKIIGPSLIWVQNKEFKPRPVWLQESPDRCF